MNNKLLNVLSNILYGAEYSALLLNEQQEVKTFYDQIMEATATDRLKIEQQITDETLYQTSLIEDQSNIRRSTEDIVTRTKLKAEQEASRIRQEYQLNTEMITDELNMTLYTIVRMEDMTYRLENVLRKFEANIEQVERVESDLSNTVEDYQDISNVLSQMTDRIRR